ncbi:hypothetical protein E3E36_06270 [Thermococcus sp. M36]|uniref:hypothetical protein n=1 Tax=Thermococcus sp. M36 TaxID=1638261 RepID=UPI001438EAE9|nr:hypothetical protein [Thermococcus sp. M36]NJE05753.1 hypothetical protein [Thermococcus sp. M36]
MEIELDGEVKSVHDVFFSIDAYELGIEIDFVYWAKLSDNDYVLFGEPDPTGSYLVRSPIVLIALDRIAESIRSESLVPHSSNECMECMYIDHVGKDDYIIFDRDSIELRKARMIHLSENLGIDPEFGELINRLSKGEPVEAELLDLWDRISGKLGQGIHVEELNTHVKAAVNTWGKLIALRKGVEITPDKPWADIVRLCPVTWKVLTLAVTSGSFDRFLKG